MSTNETSLHALLLSLVNGELPLEAVESAISQGTGSTQEAVAEDSVRMDIDRQGRCGYPEVIYAPGKTNAALLAGFQRLLSAGQNCLATRCSFEQGNFLIEQFPQAIHSVDSRTVRIQQFAEQSGHVFVVTAGTSDRPVALEALETLRWMNVNADILMDVGVAGPQRFLQVKHQLEHCDAVVVVAGMEGALPSVVAGWLSCPVIAVPTSVGYGAAFGGVAALLGMLNSCAANVAVVNIDAGFKGGYLAGMIAQRRSSSEPRHDCE